MWCGRGACIAKWCTWQGCVHGGGICGGGMHGREARMAGETATEVGSTHPTGMHSCYCYHPPMELQEGNLFSCVCMSFCLPSVVPHVTITQDALDLTVLLFSHMQDSVSREGPIHRIYPSTSES